MKELVYKEIEELLNGEEGLLMDLRYGEGLDKQKSDKIFDKIESLSSVETVPKSFFDLIMDTIMVITSSLEINNNKTEIMEFLDAFTDKLKNNQK